MSFTVNDLYNRLHDLVKDGYGEYELLFDYDKGESFFEYDGYYVNSAVILEITEEDESIDEETIQEIREKQEDGTALFHTSDGKTFTNPPEADKHQQKVWKEKED